MKLFSGLLNRYKNVSPNKLVAIHSLDCFRYGMNKRPSPLSLRRDFDQIHGKITKTSRIVPIEDSKASIIEDLWNLVRCLGSLFYAVHKSL